MKLSRATLLGVAAILTLSGPGRAEATKDRAAAPKGFDVRRAGVAKGKVETVEYDSKTVGTRRKLVVYTPPGYDKGKKYPVLYLLHGARFNESSWVKEGSADVILDNLLADRKITPFIVVMPNGFARPAGKPKGSNAFEDDLLTDILPHVEGRYAVRAAREHRALVGQSMGGGQALTIGLKHPDTFAWVGGFSPALFGRQANQGLDLAAAKKVRLLWLSCGDEDPLLDTLESFHEALKTKGVRHLWHVGTGAHTFAVWKNDLYLLAPRLFRQEK
jgi:enterochelin esterase-like enzyme